VGERLGSREYEKVGKVVGTTVEHRDGCNVGCDDGTFDGKDEGSIDEI